MWVGASTQGCAWAARVGLRCGLGQPPIPLNETVRAFKSLIQKISACHIFAANYDKRNRGKVYMTVIDIGSLSDFLTRADLRDG